METSDKLYKIEIGNGVKITVAIFDNDSFRVIYTLFQTVIVPTPCHVTPQPKGSTCMCIALLDAYISLLKLFLFWDIS